MISQIIARYLTDHKRLVVPQLGAFITKVPGREVVFSEMMKRDDGVLRELLGREGMSEIEAAGAIDRFVFEIRHTAESDTVYRAEGLGVFAAGPNGTIRFRFLPDEPQQAEPATPAAEAVTEAPAPAPDDRPEADSPAPQQPLPAAEVQPAEEEAPAEETRRRIRELMKHEADHPAERRSSSRPRRLDPSVLHLRELGALAASGHLRHSGRCGRRAGAVRHSLRLFQRPLPQRRTAGAAVHRADRFAGRGARRSVTEFIFKRT